jgi:hypothetical protein
MDASSEGVWREGGPYGGGVGGEKPCGEEEGVEGMWQRAVGC